MCLIDQIGINHQQSIVQLKTSLRPFQNSLLPVITYLQSLYRHQELDL